MTQTYAAGGLEGDGFAVAPGILDDRTVRATLEAMASVDSSAGVLRRGEVYAVRSLFDSVPYVRELARTAPLRSLVEPVLGPDAFAVKALLLDKTPTANWTVPWHQDLAIAVRERVEEDGYEAWSEKSGAVHVIPPPGVLEGILTIRIALDEGGPDNGPLMVLPGSHHSGRLHEPAIREYRERVAPVACPVPRGGALMMRPLLLHASHPSKAPGRRRVLHLEYAAVPLPGGVEWRWRV